MVKRGWVIATSVAVLALMGLSTFGQARVGDTWQAQIESPHPVEGAVWRQEIQVPGGTFLKFHLHTLQIGPEDLFLVFGPDGREVFSHVGPIMDPLWLPSVDGNAATLEIWPDGNSRPWGLLVDQVGYGAPAAPMAAPAPESICGASDLQDPACFGAAKQQAGDAVGRMLYQGSDGGIYACTGSLISPYNHFLTNNHCIATEAEAQSLEVRWRYQYSGCGSGTVTTDSVSTGADLVRTDARLDYSLLHLSGGTPAGRYGYLSLSSAKAFKGETIWIPQHPGGDPKKFAVTSDMDGGDCRIDKVGIAGNGAHTDVGYYADTEPGSSGSPVLDTADEIVALHHFGTGGATCVKQDMNQGVRMDKIYPEIASYLGTPQVTSMKKVGNPFRIVVQGSHFSPDIKVFIGGVEWSDVKIKNANKIVLKKGATLKAAVPRNTATDFQFQNPYVPASPVISWQWP